MCDRFACGRILVAPSASGKSAHHERAYLLRWIAQPPAPRHGQHRSPRSTDAPTYVKVANFPGLYRHSRSGRYYACKKLHGIRRERSLETCDRKIAERRLKEWVGNLEKVDAEVEKTTLDGTDRELSCRHRQPEREQPGDRPVHHQEVPRLVAAWSGLPSAPDSPLDAGRVAGS